MYILFPDLVSTECTGLVSATQHAAYLACIKGPARATRAPPAIFNLPTLKNFVNKCKAIIQNIHVHNNLTYA